MARVTLWGDFKADRVERLNLSGELVHLLRRSDVNVVNFEAPIHSEGQPIAKSGPNIRQNAEAPEWLEARGFNVVSMANNHAMDYGTEGLSATRRAFTSARVVGCGTWAEAYRPTVVTAADGLRIGVLACTHCEFGTLTDAHDPQRVGTAWAGAPDLERAIQVTGGGKTCDFLIVVAHCGVEYMEQPLPEWRERYRRWIELGADAVVASHPHVPQGWETHCGKPICYSLGNFCFDRLGKTEAPANWENSLVCVLDIDREQGVGMQMRPITFNAATRYIGDSGSAAYARYLDRVNATLHDEQAYIKYVDDYAARLLPFYMDQFARGGLVRNPFSVGCLKGLAEGLMGRGFFKGAHWLNNLQCESHRWAILRAMRGTAR